MSTDTNAAVSSVTVQPAAVAAMALHAVQHPHTAVHGVLLGHSTNHTAVTVTEAVPVCHNTPSQPVVEAALGLIPHRNNKNDTVIVGWYTAPLLADDAAPGPVALRLASQLGIAAIKDGSSSSSSSSTSIEPILLVLNNTALGAAIGKTSKTNHENTSLVQAYGRDFGNQWLERLSTTIEHAEGTTLAIEQALQDGVVVVDLLDFYADPSLVWPSSSSLTERLANVE